MYRQLIHIWQHVSVLVNHFLASSYYTDKVHVASYVLIDYIFIVFD